MRQKGRNSFRTALAESWMVTKTHSNESIVDMEEMNEFRLDVASLKKDVADLKSLKTEMREIKGLLRELCKQKNIEETEGEKGEATTQLPQDRTVAQAADGAGPSNPNAEVRVAIETTTNAPNNELVNLWATTGGASRGNGHAGQPTQQFFTDHQTRQNMQGGNVGGHQGFTQGTGMFHGNSRVHVIDPQRNMYGGNGNHYAEAIIKGPRLEIPLFGGEEPVDWLKQCEKFFEITGTPVDQWVNLALAHLQGRAIKWYRGIGIPWQLISWPQWCAMVCTRFSAADVHEAVELFQNVKQHGQTVDQYIDKFEEYMDLVKRDHPYLQEQYLNSCFIGGLRNDIKHDVSGHKPQGLLETYWYANNYEKAANARRMTMGLNRNRLPNQNVINQGRNFANKVPPKTNGDKKCWFCKEVWFPGHQCKVKKALNALMLEDEELEEKGEEEKEVKTREMTQENGETSPDESGTEELMYVSQNAMQGTTRPDTFSMIIQIHGKRAIGLVDSGSTSTFMDEEFALRNNCPTISTEVKRVEVAGGGELKSGVQVPETNYQI